MENVQIVIRPHNDIEGHVVVEIRLYTGHADVLGPLISDEVVDLKNFDHTVSDAVDRALS